MESGSGAGRGEWRVLAAIVAFGVGLRLIRLGSLSFAGDEETTTLAAIALLEGWPPRLPGGLVYVRGLPFTLLEAFSVAALGVSELSLRLLPALLAGPRLFAAWWFARPFLGPRLALGAAALLALAPLDVEHSRNARMYSMLATFDLLALAAVVHSALGAPRALLGGACALTAVATHIAAVTHAPVALAAALGRGLDARRRLALCGIGGASVAGFLAFRMISKWSYSGAGKVPGAASDRVKPLAAHLAALTEAASSSPAQVLLGAGALLAAGLLLLALRRTPGWLPRLALVAMAAAALAGSPAFAALGALAALLLAGVSPFEARRALPLVAPAGAALAGWAGAGLLHHGVSAAGLEQTARLLLGLPAPNWFELAAAAPGVFALAAVGALVAADRGARATRETGADADVGAADARTGAKGLPPGLWLALLAAAFGPVLISGLYERTGSLRFQLHGLAPLLTAALLGADALARRCIRAPSAALAAALLVTGIGVRPDQALAAVLRGHGPLASPWRDLAVAPDHRGAAEFLRSHASPGDWIAAEDPLQQTLLIGRTHVWLRRFEDADKFLRLDSRGTTRDIYTGSRHVSDLAELRAAAHEAGRRVVWLVTSGECEIHPEWYRSDEPHAQLRAWEPQAWFQGADGLTRVYRLVDGEIDAPRRLGQVRP